MAHAPVASATGNDARQASDRSLMDHIAAGDEVAFDELYRRHGRHALMQARKLCASRELAEDVAQETFLSLWRSASRYRPALGSVPVWLSSMVRNRAIDAWRRTSVRPVEVSSDEHGPDQLRSATGADTPAPERAVVLALLAELPAEQREAVFLAYFAGMTHAEISDWSGAPLGTIKSRIRLGLEKLRAGLDDQSLAPSTSHPGALPAVADLDELRRRRSGSALTPGVVVPAA
jgi:RNA polymerase sigma-70 factor (ECF subfamily)